MPIALVDTDSHPRPLNVAIEINCVGLRLRGRGRPHTNYPIASPEVDTTKGRRFQRLRKLGFCCDLFDRRSNGVSARRSFFRRCNRP